MSNRQLKELVAELNRLVVKQTGNTSGLPMRGRRRRRRRRATTTPGTTGAPVTNSMGGGSGGPGRGRKRRSSPGCNLKDGEIRLRRKELLDTVKIPASRSSVKGHIDIIPSSFSFLKTLDAAFERHQWRALKFWWKPAVGTTFGGLFSSGIDWDFAGTADVERKKIVAHTPSSTHSVWQDTEATPLVLPKDRLQSRLWYLPDASEYVDKGPGRLQYAADTATQTVETTIGEIWVGYDVILSGTKS